MSNNLLYPMINAAANSPANPVFQKDLIPLIGNLIDLNTSSVPVTINNTIVMTGTTADTTTTYMEYAYNVITEASPSNFAARLPYPPIEGKSVIIINTSGTPIVIYPSIAGGSINGVVNGAALIPSDGRPYTFFCYENPLPGAWSWSAPATTQYDSGEIVASTTLVNDTIAGFVTGNAVAGLGWYISSGWAYDGINKPVFAPATLAAGSPQAPFKPTTPWNQITKIKVYTNLSATDSIAEFALQAVSTYNRYNIATGALINNSGGNTGDYDGIYPILTKVPGATLGVGALTPNIGDPGTAYTEVDYANIGLTSTGDGGIMGNFVGDMYVGQQLVGGILRDVWFTRVLNFAIRPFSGEELTGFKYRFFIEYN